MGRDERPDIATTTPIHRGVEIGRRHRLATRLGLVTDQANDALLATKLVGELEGAYFVPGYQRGYRWGAPEVVRLLDDVQASKGDPYFLQPVVVKNRHDGTWELIDGQQRLTTLFLILQYIQKHALPSARPRFTLDYETRPKSRQYLFSLAPDERSTNIDYFHIFKAFESVREWFERQPNPLQAAIDFFTATSKSLQIIWYEAPQHMDSKELFRRLNVGRIPLTDAELVKALLLARLRGADGHSDRTHQMAAQWDVIERDLRNPELWAFVTRAAPDDATHIGLLLDALADKITKPPAGPRPLFHTFETLRPTIEISAKKVWEDIQDMHSLILGWYEDRTLYHWVGYLVATGEAFAAIVAMTQGLSKSDLRASLAAKIRRQLDHTEEQVKELTYPMDKCAEVLLLMNVESVRQRAASSERYSFQAHHSGSWSLEHIHAQNAEPLRTAEQWSTWLRLHRDALVSLGEVDQPLRDSLVADIDVALAGRTLQENTFRQLEQRVVHALSADDPDGDEAIHSISNLALLSAGANSALNNSVFEVKRREILKLDKRGAYIPACTRNAFLKYYTEDNAQQIHFWGPQDRQGYLNAMLTLIREFLNPSSAA